MSNYPFISGSNINKHELAFKACSILLAIPNPPQVTKVCNDYGTMVDVFIPNKKSRAGKRFAFVRFIKYAMGKVKDVNYIPNLRTLLMDEGFFDVKLKYLGGMLVMFEFDKVDTKVNMMQHIGVKSWFHVIQDAFYDIVSNERIVWVDIKGIPLNVWSRETFMRIGKKWRETLDIEDNVDSSFGHKRLCIKTKQPVSIPESFKIVFKGKVLLVCAKELFTWNPTFLAHKEMAEEVSGDDSGSDVEEVSETIFGDNSYSPNNNSDEMGKQHSEDPFKIYDILKKQTGGEAHEVSSSLSHPPGFTPEVSEIRKENDQGAEEFSSLVNAKVMNNSQEVYQEINRESVDPNVVKEGGSVLGVLEDMIRVGQAMGYTMDGCVKDFERIIGTQGADDNGETIILGDFNEVRSIDERRGSCFNPSSARVFDYFISLSGLVDVKLEGYAFTWPYPSGSEMSKLDRFLVSEGLFGFWSDSLSVLSLMDLKAIIRCWVKDKRMHRRLELQRKLHDINQMEAKDSFQKSKIKWAIEGDENSKFFHVDEGLFKGVHLQGSISISHLFYADDAMFIGEWSDANLKVKKITWAAWDKILASKKNGGSDVSSFHALNRALLLKWVWHFISQDGSLWFCVIQALYGPSIVSHPVNLSSNWCSIVRELHLLTDKELDKKVLVADKMKAVVGHSFRRPVRAGSEHQQMVDLNSLLESVSLSQSYDRWFCDLTGDGEFRVKEESFIKGIQDELVGITDYFGKFYQRKVLPLFYKGDPSYVRSQQGSFKEAFQAHEASDDIDPKRVQKWKQALRDAGHSMSWSTLRTALLSFIKGKFFLYFINLIHDVRSQQGSFKEAFQAHEANGDIDPKRGALGRRGFTISDHNMLLVDQDMRLQLLHAIEESKIYVVFSNNYASSVRSFDELVDITYCLGKFHQRKVLPLFYKVDPSEVRSQQGSFMEAFQAHEANGDIDPKRVQK
nr:RNA-directed DNA polymerase, eukaryota [Tanacetum cinerariifolium]